MAFKICAGLLMYRFGKEGLEIFLVQPQDKTEKAVNQNPIWDIPKGYVSNDENSLNVAMREFAEETGIVPTEEEFIQLDEIEFTQDGKVIKAWAFEGNPNDFDLPLKKILGKTESPLRLRRKHHYIKEKGAYFVIKEAVKKVFPEQVSMIKELQEILSTRNMLKYL